jgi:hypothetical protein
MAGPDDPDDPDETPPPLPDEPRAKDIAKAKTTADLDERLDPATVAQLAAWFGLPSVEQLQEEEEARAREAEENDPYRERNERQARVAADVDPAMINRLERWKRAGDAMKTELGPPIEPIPDPTIVRHDHAFADRLGVIGDEREVNRPQWIDDALSTSTPQAILRDLHRPELDFYRVYTRQDPVPTLTERTAEIRTIACADYQVRPQPRVWATTFEAFAEIRFWKRANWAELPIPKRPKESEEPDSEEPDSEET